MSMIKVEDLSFSYPSASEDVFDHVSFQIDTDWKLGFIGRNGRGKTTFLRLLMGMYEYQGKIESSVEFDYFPYPVSDPERLTFEVLEEVCPLAEAWELLRELSYLEVREDVLWRPFSTLSRGEQTKVLLAGSLCRRAHLYVWDEPLNYIDLYSRMQIENLILEYKPSMIFVEHDQAFREAVATGSLKLENNSPSCC